MKKQVRLVAVILNLSLMITSCGYSVRVPKKEDEVDTSSCIGTPLDNISYQAFDLAIWEQELAEEEVLLQADPIDPDAVLEIFGELSENYQIAVQDQTLAGLFYFCDTTDDFYKEQYQILSEQGTKIEEDYCTLGRTLAKDYDLEDRIRTMIGQKALSTILNYSPLSEAESQLAIQEAELISEYYELYSQVTYDEGSAAYTNLETCGPQMAEIYAELVSVRSQMNGGDSYVEEMDQSYYRSYEDSEVTELEDVIKNQIAPILSEKKAKVVKKEENLDRTFAELSADEELLIARNSMDLISSDMQEVFAFAEENGLILLEEGDQVMDAGYTTYLSDYSEPILFLKGHDEAIDFAEIVHEFGHFYANYNGAYANLDLAELQSQGLEALYCCKYPKIIGQSSGKAMTSLGLSSLLTVVIDGAELDEFERTAYALEAPTADELTELFAKLDTEYGYEQGGYPGAEYAWTLVHHIYDQPLYYFSYSVSAIAALELWAIGTDDFDQAVQIYEGFETCKYGSAFVSAIERAGLYDPWTQEAVDSFSAKLRKAL